MLVRAHDGSINHHIFVVVIARQQLENTLENSALRPPIKPLVEHAGRNEPMPRSTKATVIWVSLIFMEWFHTMSGTTLTQQVGTASNEATRFAAACSGFTLQRHSD